MTVKYCLMENFVDWLESELQKRDWRPAELARRSGLDTGFISNLLNRKRKPGPETCIAIARALDLPEEEVFRRAGLLSPKTEDAPNLGEWIHLFISANGETRDQMLELARFLLGQSKKK